MITIHKDATFFVIHVSAHTSQGIIDVQLLHNKTQFKETLYWVLITQKMLNMLTISTTKSQNTIVKNQLWTFIFAQAKTGSKREKPLLLREEHKTAEGTGCLAPTHQYSLKPHRTNPPQRSSKHIN